MRFSSAAFHFLALALAATAPPARAESFVFSLNPEGTEIAFTLAATLHTVEGRLSAAQGEILIETDSGDVEGEIVINAHTAETGNRQRDAKMHRDVLKTEEHPEIVFKPKEIQGKLATMGPSTIELLGEVLIKGSRHPLRLVAQLDSREGFVEGRASFVVPYVEWGLSDPSTFLLRVAKEVQVTVTLAGQISVPD